MERGIYTKSEIFSQPNAWAQALAVVEQGRLALVPLFEDNYDQILFTGCGSTYYLSIAAAALFQKLTGKLARAVAGGELLLNPKNVLVENGILQKTLLIAISRSGTTTETVRAVQQFKHQQRGPVIVITNYGDQPLFNMADVALVIDQGQEESVAQTRSFASMYVAATALAALAAGDEQLLRDMQKLPGAGRKLLTRYDAEAQKLGENLSFDRFYFLGSGERYGLACEVNLKMKEMSLTHSEPFHFLEFRHGPMSMVTENTVIVGFLSDKNFNDEQAVLEEMRAKGGTIIAVSESGTGIALESSVPESVRGVMYLPILQLVAFYRSLAKGLNPDQPKNLTAVVVLP
jgi:glutamine---fructose-6-phosphate transaminase (isomerizing)